MKQYPEISYYGDYWGIPVVAFEKYDGSNLRFEFSQKRGFYKFGTRNTMIDSNSDPFGFAIELFMNKYSDDLSDIFRSKTYRNIQSFICFAELYGSKSEFGQHNFEDDDFNITMFDINQYKKGFIPPRQFIRDFGHLEIPRIVYQGNLTHDLIKDIKQNIFNLKEGVVCKSISYISKGNQLYYCKIKTDDWFDRLRSKYFNLYKDEIKQILK